jgi:hypothetical protein
VLKYPGGDNDWCNVDANGVPDTAGTRRGNRSFSIELLCAPTQGNMASFAAASVVETNTCDYRVQLKSLAGCPTACITGNTLCNGNGICGYNTDSQRNQCFCNAGANGAQCAAHAAPKAGMGAEGIILIIVCLMLAGVLGLVGYMFVRLRKLQVDPSAYGELQGKCACSAGFGRRARARAGSSPSSHPPALPPSPQTTSSAWSHEGARRAACNLQPLSFIVTTKENGASEKKKCPRQPL